MNQNKKHTNNQYPISEKEKQCIIENNRADIKLYEFCLKKFNSSSLWHDVDKLSEYQIENNQLKYLLELHRKINRIL